jgi:hypothetical protein
MIVDLGSPGAIAGGAVAILAGVLLVAFFATGREVLGRANDAASAVMVVLLIPAAVAVWDLHRDTGPPAVAITIVGVAAMVETAIASTLTAFGRLSVTQLVVWQGGGFVVLFLWVLGVSLLALGWERLPLALGWLGVLAAVLVVVAIASILRLIRGHGGLEALGDLRRPPLVPVISFVVAFACFPVWCIWLGVSL